MRTFDWLKKNANPNNVQLSLTFVGKEDYAPLQSADILAYEANKRFRDVDKPERRAWTALDPKERIISAHYGKHNMEKFVSELSGLLSQLRSSGWDGTFV